MKHSWFSRRSASLFWSLVKEMPLSEFVTLLSCGKGVPNVYAFDHYERSACVFPKGEVPWPVEYILCFHHPKHVLQSKRKISPHEVGRALWNWDQRLRWRLTLANQPKDQWGFLKVRTPVVSPCETSFAGSFEAFSQEIRQKIYSELLKTRGRMRARQNVSHNMYGVVRLGMQLLGRGPYRAVRTDKDGGFVLVPKHVFIPEMLRILSNTHRYAEVNKTPDFGESVVHGFVDIVLSNVPGHLEDNEKTSFLRSILQPLRGRVQNVFSKLKCTVKTHKSPGHVEWRGIHSTVNTPFTGAIRFIVSLLRPVLSSLEHLLKNSEALVKRLSLLRVSSGSRFLKIDVKEYFMEGLHSQFVQCSAEFVEVKWRPFYKAVLQHILETQFIEVESLDERLWKALKGSGMGLGFSGELADITFYATVERALLNDPIFLHEHSVELYVRFKDDILVILGGTHTSRISFFKSLRERSPVWKLEAESVEEFSCHFLDLTLAKGGRWKSTGLLDVGIYHKPTSLHQPLAPHSAHSAHVHVAWPKGMITRAKRLCNTRSTFHLEILHLKRLLAARFGTPYADHILKPIPKQPPSIASHEYLTSRLIIPYHSAWESSRFRSILRNVQSRYHAALMRDMGVSIRIQVSYALAAPHLHVRLAKLRCDGNGGDYIGWQEGMEEV